MQINSTSKQLVLIRELYQCYISCIPAFLMSPRQIACHSKNSKILKYVNSNFISCVFMPRLLGLSYSRPALSAPWTRRPRLSILYEGFSIYLTLIVSGQRYTTNKILHNKIVLLHANGHCYRREDHPARHLVQCGRIKMEKCSENKVAASYLLLRDSCCKMVERTLTEKRTTGWTVTNII